MGDGMKILVIGAHPDDEVYGCGGAIARLSKEGHDIHVLIVSEGSTAQYENKEMITKKREEAEKVKSLLGIKEYIFGDFPDMKLDTVPHIELNKFISETVSRIKPEWIFTHSPLDLNKDHRVVFHSTMVAARPQVDYVKRILCYEVPSTTELGEEPFRPEVFIDITDYLQKKSDAVSAYKTELREFPHGRSAEAIEALAKYRGYASNYRYAEAFTIAREKI